MDRRHTPSTIAAHAGRRRHRRGAEPSASLRLVDHLASPAALDLRTFLTRNRVPFEWVDVDRARHAAALAAGGALRGARLPLCLLPDGTRLEAPSRLELARRLGLPTRPALPVYDLAIIGGGPAGLTAAVYAASEGLRTAMLEREAPGGQAGASARIENYPGFPLGIGGQELAERAREQAQRFGAEVVLANEVVAADATRRGPFHLTLLDGAPLRSHVLLLATGMRYRPLEAPGVAALTGKGICYGSGVFEAARYRGRVGFVVGGGNSAGQAAVHAAGYARHVTLLVRGASLTPSMSHYLIRQLEATENLTVRYRTEVARAEGEGHLEALVLRDRDTGAETRAPADCLAIFVGQQPPTEWAEGLLERDAEGYLLTGPDLPGAGGPLPGDGARRQGSGPRWPLARAPLSLETSVPGVFAAGDVRHGSVKRVASAVGEGAMAAQLVHAYLGELAGADARALAGAGVPADRVGGSPALDWHALVAARQETHG